MGFNSNKHSLNFSKKIILALFLVLYLIVFWFLFFTKGIYVDGHFYKKSANLTTITYTCRNPFAEYKKIVLQKQLGGAVIALDNAYVLDVNSNGDVSVARADDTDKILPDARWDLIATQAAETNRGTVSVKSHFVVIVLYVLFFLSKKYNTKIYEFFHRNKVAGENYYRIFDKAFTIVTIMLLIYFILPV